jgi:hypothetical protein
MAHQRSSATVGARSAARALARSTMASEAALRMALVIVRGRLAHGLGHCGPPMLFGRQRAFRALRDRLGFLLGDGRQDVNREAVGLRVARCRGLANRIGQQNCKVAVP